MARITDRDIPLGRMQEHIATLKHPERTAYKAGMGIFSGYTFQEWPNRESMARTIRMQERGENLMGGRPVWKAVVKLGLSEGY